MTEKNWDISDEYEAMSLTHVSGTRTITTHEMISTTERGLLYKQKRKNVCALPGNYARIVLMGNQVDDCIAGIGKTSTQSLILPAKKESLNLAQTYSLTTGYESKQINFYLISETHEKREYLGEFSLTHEETQLFSFKEGGDYHDTDKESVTAIV